MREPELAMEPPPSVPTVEPAPIWRPAVEAMTELPEYELVPVRVSVPAPLTVRPVFLLPEPRTSWMVPANVAFAPA